MNDKNQFICFLSGAGGTGKSRVLKNGMRHYCKLLCNELGVEFTKRTIVVTAVTGSAAVTIHGETMHLACSLCSRKKKWSGWRMEKHNHGSCWWNIIYNQKRFWKIEWCSQQKNDAKIGTSFGNLQMVFPGDFCQLKPPQAGLYPL